MTRSTKLKQWWSRLHEKNPESLDAVKQVFLSEKMAPVLVTLLFLLVGYFGIYRPYQGRIGSAQKQLADERKAAELVAGIEKSVERINAHAPLFPRKNEMGWWLNTLIDLGEKLEISINLISPRTVDELGEYDLLSIDIGLACRYPKLEKLLQSLEKMDRLIRVDALHLEKMREGKGIQGTLTVSTLALK